jgi:SAM-dependent methyltransferase
MNVFDKMDNYWAEIADQNSTNRQIQFLRTTHKTTGLVLDLACGTGRHLIPLSNEGYNMVGLDLSSKLLRIAKNRMRSIQLFRGDMKFLPFRPGTFSAAISMDTSFGYLPSEQDDLQTLDEVKETLDQNGLLIIDVFNRQHLILKYKQNRLSNIKWVLLPVLLKPNRLLRWILLRFFKWKEYPDFFLLQKRKVTTNGEKLHDLWLVCDKSDGQIRVFNHTVRLYELVHLQGLLERAGFTVNSVYGDYEGQVFSPNSNRLILVATAK